MTNLNPNTAIEEIAQKWENLHETEGIFSYKLNVQKSRKLPGKHNFYCELNPQRYTLRRLPQQIVSLNPTFDDSKFNFTKINPLECIARYGNVSFIINKSPLTKHHSLICPDLERKLPQKLTEYALEFCVDFLLKLDDKCYRVGYNSPGALASVNHLHLHLIRLEEDIFSDRVEIVALNEHNFIHKISPSCDLEAICFLINSSNLNSAVKSLYGLIEWMCNESIPHNLYMMKDLLGNVKVFVYAREHPCIIKDLTASNIGFCEISGYFCVGDEQRFNELSEDVVIAKIKQDVGNVYERVYAFLENF